MREYIQYVVPRMEWLKIKYFFFVSTSSRLNYYYYMEFCQIDPQLKSDQNFKITNYETLFQMLNNKLVDVRLLERISRDYQWNFQRVLVEQVKKNNRQIGRYWLKCTFNSFLFTCFQIETILNMQELEYEISENVLGNEQLIVNLVPEKVLALCHPYFIYLTDTKYLAERLIAYIDTINTYYYELYLCVIHILMRINQLPASMGKWSRILLFLKHKMMTRRTKYFSQTESDWWLNEQNDGGILPKIAEFRFPFRHLLTDNDLSLLRKL